MCSKVVSTLFIVSVVYAQYNNNNNNFQYTVNSNGYRYSVADSPDGYTGGYQQNIQQNEQKQNEYIPVIENGVPVDTPEVQRAKAEHFQLYAKAAAEAARASQRSSASRRSNNNNYYSNQISYVAPVQNPYYYNNGIADQYSKPRQASPPVENSHLVDNPSAIALAQGQREGRVDRGSKRFQPGFRAY